MNTNIQIKDLIFKPFIMEDSIQESIKSMGEKINEYYDGKNLHMVVVLKGAFIFAADLLRHITVDHAVHFVKFSSYKGTKSMGEITEEFSLKLDVHKQDILIVEDIVDTGTTLQYFMDKLETKAPASLQIASLLVKPSAMKFDLYIKFRGYDIENDFVVGYGLDYDDKGRNLRHIYQLVE